MNYTVKEKILLSIVSLIKREGKCSYSNLVKETFHKYPSDFALNEYSQWPDSLKLDRPLRELREDGLIQGNPQTFYTVTKLGESFSERLIRSDGYIRSGIRKVVTRSPLGNLINKIKESNDFVSFTKNKEKFRPNNMKIRELTGHTLETPATFITSMLKFLKQDLDSQKESNLIQYLNTYIKFFKQ